MLVMVYLQSRLSSVCLILLVKASASAYLSFSGLFCDVIIIIFCISCCYRFSFCNSNLDILNLALYVINEEFK